MKKTSYFDKFDGRGWPSPKELEPYFLTAEGRRRFFQSGNDSWGFDAEGVDGTSHRAANEGRIDVHLTIQGHQETGVLLCYQKWGSGVRDTYYSKGNLSRLGQWVKTSHGDRMPVALFIPFEVAWVAVKEFMETDAALPRAIEWIAARELPPNAFPDT